MKKMTLILAGMIVLAWGAAARAELKPGPGGGKLVGDVPDQAELMIDDNGIVSIAFLDDAGQPAAVGGRTVKLFAQPESGRVEVALREEEGKLIAVSPLPQPEGYTLVVQIRADEAARPVNTRVRFLTYVCAGCSLKEYACTCEEH